MKELKSAAELKGETKEVLDGCSDDEDRVLSSVDRKDELDGSVVKELTCQQSYPERRRAWNHADVFEDDIDN